MRSIVYWACGVGVVLITSGCGTVVSYAANGKAPPPTVGDQADDFTLSDLEGNKVSLSHLTERGPAALVVLRGYVGGTCPFCTRQFGELLGAAKDFEKAGAIVALIYPGEARDLDKHAAQFVAGQQLPKSFRFLLDPDFKFVQAYGIRSQSVGATAYPASFIIDQHQVARLAHVGRSANDRAAASMLLAALPMSTKVQGGTPTLLSK